MTLQKLIDFILIVFLFAVTIYTITAKGNKNCIDQQMLGRTYDKCLMEGFQK